MKANIDLISNNLKESYCLTMDIEENNSYNLGYIKALIDHSVINDEEYKYLYGYNRDIYTIKKECCSTILMK